MIKSFRGILADGGQTRIRLGTIRGEIGYRINKLEGFPSLPTTTDFESVLQVWSVKQDPVATEAPLVDFSNSRLLGALFYTGMGSTYSANSDIVVFDNVTFNQDIFITHTEGVSNFSFNYYLELEQVKLNLGESTVATLMDMRGDSNID